MYMLKKKLLVLNAVAILGLGSIFSVQGISAESINELKKNQESVQEKKATVKSDITSTEKTIAELQANQEKLDAEIKRIDLAVEETNAKIREKNIEIAETNEEIATLKEEITVLEERIAKRNEILKNRAVSFQESGGSVNYLEVLLGSTSFGDFIDRVSAVTTILEADEDLVKQHEADKKELQEKKAEVETKLTNLEAMKAELETMKAELAAQKAAKDKVMAQLELEEEEAHNHMMNLEEEQSILAAQEEAIKKAIALEEKRIADEKAAAAKAAAEAAKNKQNSSSSSSSSNSSSSSSGSSSSSSNTGGFIRPASGTFTSGYGARWGKTHYGVDIANSADVPIWAAASGVVIRSYYSSSYGNTVLISHSINGQTYTTLYAHLETRMVSTGQTVSQGQQIGIMGNTGRSTGQHLHFELHKGAWTASKANAVNPAPYIGL